MHVEILYRFGQQSSGLRRRTRMRPAERNNRYSTRKHNSVRQRSLPNVVRRESRYKLRYTAQDVSGLASLTHPALFRKRRRQTNRFGVDVYDLFDLLRVAPSHGDRYRQFKGLTGLQHHFIAHGQAGFREG